MAYIDLPAGPSESPGSASRRGRGPITDRPEPSLPLYMREMGAEPLLTREQETHLATDLAESRDLLASRARRLPAAARGCLFGATAGPPVQASDWDIAEIDRFIDGLETAGVGAKVRREIRALRQRLERSRSKMTVANLRLVIHIARRYTRSGMPLLDLIQEGNLGLMRAVEKFDVGLGNRFSTYAYWWIKQAIERGIADKSRVIRVPVHLGEKRKRIARVTNELNEELSRQPKPAEIAARLQMSVEQVEEILFAIPKVRSLDEPLVGRQGNDCLQIPDSAPSASVESQFELREQTEMIESALQKRLTARERDIIRLRYGLGNSKSHTLDEIGSIIGLSRERVRQLEQQAIEKLRRSDALVALLGAMGAA